jgi:hypothetical protein
MNTPFRIIPELASIGLVVAVLSFSVQAAELSSPDLRKAQNDLQGFEVSGRGIQPPPSFVYEGEFPRVEFEAELESDKKLLLAAGTLLPIHLINAYKRDKLSDAELVVAVRAGRAFAARAKRAEEKRSSEQDPSNGGNAPF